MVVVHLFVFIFWPDLYQPQLPLTLVKINNSYLSGQMLMISFTLLIGIILISFGSLFEGGAMRFAIIYNIELVLRLSNGIK